MKLAVNENNEIIGFARIGGLPDAVDFDENKAPSDFDYNFKPSFYLFKDGEIVKNPNYVTPEPPVIGPSNLEKQVATLSYQQMIGSQTINALQQQNAQIAYQIMTGGN
ncbi:DUF2977 domain-containing protein [Pediococcus acidilactici]|uniref:DUF2977 domain-containing protein n=1 Tax=Pediococcus acidilactici TaxID=1254 RepID=UPI0019138327|nr:DUF2977 domain-containing protein [Pediococcus acidilactici]QQP83938.1 DUF2977 domain-containing protein [Pediococcus acidilactici]